MGNAWIKFPDIYPQNGQTVLAFSAKNATPENGFKCGYFIVTLEDGVLRSDEWGDMTGSISYWSELPTPPEGWGSSAPLSE
jgi:hypothetical protein